MATTVASPHPLFYSFNHIDKGLKSPDKEPSEPAAAGQASVRNQDISQSAESSCLLFVQNLEDCIQQLHTQSVADIHANVLGVAPSTSSASPLLRLQEAHLAAMRCCVEQAVLGSLHSLTAAPHIATQEHIRAQTEYYLLALDAGRTSISLGGVALQPPIASAVMSSDEACDAVTARATAFVCNTLHLPVDESLPEVAAAVGSYISATQPSESAVDSQCFPLAEVLQRIRRDPDALACCSDMYEYPLSSAALPSSPCREQGQGQE